MSDDIVEIDDDTFEREVLGSDRPVLVDFGATWCGPCKALFPVVERIAAKHRGALRVVTVDIDDAPRTARAFSIRSAPTLLLFADGKEVTRHVGVTNDAGLERLLAVERPGLRG